LDPVPVGASFAVDTFQLTVTDGVGGSVSSTPSGISCASGTCTATFNYGQQVMLNNMPSGGYRFGVWSGDCSGGGSCMVTMDQARSVGASFVQQYDLTVSPKPTGGTVTGTGSMSCGTNGATCKVTLDTGTMVTLGAGADSGYRPGAWTGCTPSADL